MGEGLVEMRTRRKWTMSSFGFDVFGLAIEQAVVVVAAVADAVVFEHVVGLWEERSTDRDR